MITVKELYELALALGYENAIIGLAVSDDDFENDDYECFNYCEPIEREDIDFGYLYNTQTREPIKQTIWLYNHKVEDND